MSDLAEVLQTNDTAGGVPACDYVIMSGYHDYRSRRKANLHFIADELKHRGTVLFLSLRFSRLSRFKQDPRHDLAERANRLETCNGVLCYLRFTPIHPMRLPPFLAIAERAMFWLYASHLPSDLQKQIATAKIIFIESGIAITFLPLIKRLNRSAEVVYMASDSLKAIQQAETIRRRLRKHAHLINGARVPSPYLKSDIPRGIPTFLIPHGIEKEAFDRSDPSPYEMETLNAVSVGSMLFDSNFFEIAGASFPQITFHVIGSGYKASTRGNVIYYPEMPFYATLPYLKHCSFAVAPYGFGLEQYLAHTSMKLMQYHYLGIPSVCPELVALAQYNRFGYKRDSETSIRSAIISALSAGRARGGDCLTWSEVTDRLLSPSEYSDTALP